MSKIKTDNKWFNTVPTGSLCRAGGNGPNHPSQIKGLELLDEKDISFLDVGCGSATTLECLQLNFSDKLKKMEYKGVDASKNHPIWCMENFPGYWFSTQDGYLQNEANDSWDVVWSRHVVDHMDSFEKALDQHLRVARRKVICILWYGLGDTGEHIIKNVEYDGFVYNDEYLNHYSREKVNKYLKNKQPEWDHQVIEGIGLTNKKTDIIISLTKHE